MAHLAERRGGRPPQTVSDEVLEALLDHLRNGLARADACALVGLPRVGLYPLLQRDPAFALRVEQAEAEAAKVALDVIWEAVKGGDVRMASWWLAHRRAPTWGDVHPDADRTFDTPRAARDRELFDSL
jgi:hypothetical protein